MANNVTEAQATLLADLERTWRQWNALIAELRAETEAEDDEDDLFASTSKRPKANIPAATRRELEKVLEARRQTAQREAEESARKQAAPSPDPDMVRMQLLEHIAAELEGRVHHQGMALVWWNGQLTTFDHRSVMQSTSDMDYLAAGLDSSGPSSFQTIAVVAGAIGAGLLAIFSIWFFVLRSPSQIVATNTLPPVAVQDEAVEPWAAQTATLDGVDVNLLYRGGGYPLELCIPPRAAEAGLGETLVITSAESIRHYSLSTERTEGDAVLYICGEGGIIAAGALRETITSLPGEREQIRSITVEASDIDPDSIPPDRMRVTLQMAAGMDGELQIATGDRYAPATSSTEGDATIQTFLVPLHESEQVGGFFEATDPLPTITQLTIPAPETRMARLAAVLELHEVQASLDGGTLIVTLDVQSRADLRLLREDITARRANSVLPIQWEPQPLAANTPQQITVTIPAATASAGPLIVALGPYQAELKVGG